MDVPYVDQFFDTARWHDEGFRSRDDSIEWGKNACGIACLLMALRYFTQDNSIHKHKLLHDAIASGAYSPQGWIHSKLAELAKFHGLSSAAIDVGPDLDRLSTYLDENVLVIASVTWQFPCDGRKGGHLVLLNGYSRTKTLLTRLFVLDPSSWGREHDWIEPERFLCSFTGRIIPLGADFGASEHSRVSL